ncbi:hypothetical protein HanOQP8_Chr09g0320781 [Helianthus annuus]|nr:hypothetical protein HanLR1_Chr09g0315201 [Helianthus annuus]KAJ0711162.1 hypothetical protein HanOQP8_Chr09g0320781 [Helianthus annuus]KAJ0892765.1 hypothetical protein HanPSC8_Chr09g0369871 [Helianthus annuus]
MCGYRSKKGQGRPRDFLQTLVSHQISKLKLQICPKSSLEHKLVIPLL